MSEQPFENGFINLRDYEIVPASILQNETPRQFVLRMTGRDFSGLAYNGLDYTWQEIEDCGVLPYIGHLLQVASRPHIILRKKVKGNE